MASFENNRGGSTLFVAQLSRVSPTMQKIVASVKLGNDTEMDFDMSCLINVYLSLVVVYILGVTYKIYTIVEKKNQNKCDCYNVQRWEVTFYYSQLFALTIALNLLEQILKIIFHFFSKHCLLYTDTYFI